MMELRGWQIAFTGIENFFLLVLLKAPVKFSNRRPPLTRAARLVVSSRITCKQLKRDAIAEAGFVGKSQHE
jgi:hypothetical protein